MAKDDGTSQSAKQQDYHINNSTLSAESTNMKRININEKTPHLHCKCWIEQKRWREDPHPHSFSSSFSSKGELKLVTVVPIKIWTTGSTSSARGISSLSHRLRQLANSFSQTPERRNLFLNVIILGYFWEPIEMKGPRIFFNGISIIQSKCPVTFASTRSRREFPWQPQHMFVTR